MQQPKTAVVGIGATGAVLAAALLRNHPEVLLVDPQPGLEEALRRKGIRVSGKINYQVPVDQVLPRINDLKNHRPQIVFLATKTFHLPKVLDELEAVFSPGMKIISTHNGLGTEDLIAERFGAAAAFRMSLNYGVSLQGPGRVEAAFFNRPNHLGGLVPENRELGLHLAGQLTAGGLDTEYVDDIKRFVWKKMIMKCTMASICAVTDKTIQGALQFPPTREIADACFQEVLAVAKAQGYDLGADYLQQALAYLEKVGVHKDSMCQDLANRTRTEIDFLGGKVVEYGKEKGVPTPYYTVMTNLVKALEDNYLTR
jgi:2-dehydropantoate 2-reductase